MHTITSQTSTNQRVFHSVRQFRVSVTRPDGTHREYLRTGGSQIDHINEAAEEAGIGGAVRVLAIDATEAA